MRFQEFGSNQHPVVLMLAHNPQQLAQDSRFQDLAGAYHIIVPVLPLQPVPSPDFCREEADSIARRLAPYGGTIYALCAAAIHWGITRRLLDRADIQARELIVESGEIPPQQFLLSQLELLRQKAAQFPQGCLL